MFTGLIQQVGQLQKVMEFSGGTRLRLRAAWPEPLVLGESIAVNGVCLTAASIHPAGFDCDVLQETLKRTNLETKRAGDKLNLERALRVGETIGGHFVTGHVDGTGTINKRRIIGRDLILEISCSRELLTGIVPKGSIAIDGVSLTIAELKTDAFTVHLIPFTRAASTLDLLNEGAKVNLETDLIGKYVLRHLTRQTVPTSKPLTLEQLESAGF